MKTPRHRLDDNIKMRLTEMTWDGVDLIRLPQDRDIWRAVVKAVMNFRGFIQCAEFIDWLRNC